MTKSTFLITPTPPTSLELEPGQVGTFSFTLTSLEAPDRVQEVVLQALLIGADGKSTEVQWLVAGPQRIVTISGGETQTVTITVRPTNSSPKGEHRIKLSIADNANPNDSYADSAPVTCKVVDKPGVESPPKRLPRWLIPAIAGGVVVLGAGIYLAVRLSGGTPPPPPSAICDPTGPFDPPVVVPGFATAVEEVAAHLSPDERSLYFAANLASSLGATDLYQAQRGKVEDPFGPPVPLTLVNSPAIELDPSVSADGRTLVFFANRVPNAGFRMYVSTRMSTFGAFGAPELLEGLGALPVFNHDMQPFLTGDGEELWFASDRPGGQGAFDIYRASRVGAGFGNAAPVAELNTANVEVLPVVSADRRTVYFTTERGAATQGQDIWSSHRDTVAAPFPPPAPVASINTAKSDHPSWLSPDNCRLYITSDISGNQDIYVATRRPR